MIGSVDFLKPWHAVTTEQAEEMLRESREEIAPGHELHGVSIVPIGFSQQADDILVALDDGRVALVHLTWGRRPEPPPWPRTRIFATLDAWASQIMIPESKLY